MVRSESTNSAQKAGNAPSRPPLPVTAKLILILIGLLLAKIISDSVGLRRKGDRLGEDRDAPDLPRLSPSAQSRPHETLKSAPAESDLHAKIRAKLTPRAISELVRDAHAAPSGTTPNGTATAADARIPLFEHDLKGDLRARIRARLTPDTVARILQQQTARRAIYRRASTALQVNSMGHSGTRMAMGVLSCISHALARDHPDRCAPSCPSVLIAHDAFRLVVVHGRSVVRSVATTSESRT